MGHDIRETDVPFDIDRKLTTEEIAQTLKYCGHDVMETFHVFVENAQDFETQMDIIKQYKLPITAVSKTQTQLSAMVLGASKREYNDEFKITIPDTLRLGKYEHLRDYYMDWSENVQNYKAKLTTEIAGVPHELGFGGLHGARKGYIGEGYYILADVESYYPSLMIAYNFFSRSMPEWGKQSYIQMYNHRIELKAQKKKKEQAPYKLILNKTFGGLKDEYNDLYDPVNSNNICISGQLFLIDLIDKLESKCQIIQSNTDGVLLKLYRKEDYKEVMAICKEWSERTKMKLGFDFYRKVVQKDVNNYLVVGTDEEVKRKGSWLKELNPLDNDLPIVNKALVDYFTKNIPVEVTISKADNLIDFQMITKVGDKYDNAVYDDETLTDTVYRVFATKVGGHTLYKKHSVKQSEDKTASTPESCIIINENIEGRKIFPDLDKAWYVELANKRIEKILKG